MSGPNKDVDITSGSSSSMCSLLNLFKALITPGPIASPHDLSLGKIALSIMPIYDLKNTLFIHKT